MQDKIKKIYEEIFGYTPLTERLDDIQKQFLNLYRYNDINDLKNHTGNLLSTLIQLCNESGWDMNKLIQQNLDLIESRKEQYQTLGRKKRIALYGGAFDPPTKGHMQVAEFVLNTSGVFDEVWFMPANTHMYNKSMRSTNDRLKMLELMTAKDGRMKVFDYEIKHNLSGETFKMVKHLLSNPEYENFDFSMIIGQDNANTFDKWVNYKHLETMLSFVVVPRKGVERDPEVNWYLNKPHIYLQKETEIMEISSTDVRDIIKQGKPYQLINLNKYVDNDVINYILNKKLYV